MEYAIVIPALEPEESLLTYIDELLDALAGPVLVVDDGSGPRWAPIFEAIAEKERCVVLRHEVNRGKGRAIKTAIQYYRSKIDYCGGIVTVDCDGQHAVADVAKVCRAMNIYNSSLVLGCRNFDGDNVPARSRAGNKATSAFMRFLYGINLEDTQTGLRGMPNAMLKSLAKLRGDRYDYEINVLLYAKHNAIPMQVVPIETIYTNNNEGSHYRSFVDSARIGIQLSRGLLFFGGSALIAGLVDYGLFVFMTKTLLSALALGQRILIAAVVARIISSIINYTINRKTVFGRGQRMISSITRYYMLWVVLLTLSFSLTYLFSYITGWDEALIKIMVDILLGVASYQFQLHWVFK